MITLIPADLHLLTASGTLGRGGSIIAISPTNVRFSRGKFTEIVKLNVRFSRGKFTAIVELNVRFSRGKFTGIVELNVRFSSGEVAHRIANRKISSSSPALPTLLRVRDISNLSSHTVHSAECTGNCA